MTKNLLQIINPIDNKLYSIYKKIGLTILKKYIKNYKKGGVSELTINLSKNWTRTLYEYLKSIELNEPISDYISILQFRTSFDGKNITMYFTQKNMRCFGDRKEKCYICEIKGLHNPKFICPSWENIECGEKTLPKGVVIKTDCTFGDANSNTVVSVSRGRINYPPYYNVFVKNSGKNFREYVEKIKSGEISRDKNSVLFNYLFKILVRLRGNETLECAERCRNKINLDNHNEDVNTLHFKFMSRS